MAFRDYQKHCTECKYGEPCGKFHLYLMILEPTIKMKKRFKEANPDYVDGAPLYYVGKTKHHPRCRQNMHQTYIKQDIQNGDATDRSRLVATISKDSGATPHFSCENILRDI